MTNRTVAAISTAQGEGGIGVIRISGDDAVKTADKVFKSVKGKKLSEMNGYTAAFGKIYDGGEEIDEAVALVFKAPHSYTGENVVELSCHGGIYITQRVLRAVFNAGAFPAEAGEFTKRAFLNGKIDLTEAEAVMDIISAKSSAAAKTALCVKEGVLRKRIDGIKNTLLSLAAHLCAWADYPDEDIPEVSADSVESDCKNAADLLKNLLDGYDSGQAVKQGIDTVIAGRPNVGKSTLMNLLSGSRRSIVTDIPGTTRDIVENTVTLGNVILNLSDTAGLRNTEDEVEKIGVDMAKQRLKTCGLLIAVFDNSEELNDDDLELIKSAENVPCVAVINKTDLDNKIDIKYIKDRIKTVISISAATGEGRDELTAAVEKIAGTENFNPSEGVLANERQRLAAARTLERVTEAANAVRSGVTLDAVTVLIEDAISSLLELTGESCADEVVDRVFHNFCVGK